MKVQNVTEEIVRQAIEKTGHMVLHDFQYANQKGTAFRFTLRPITGDRYYGRISPHSGRKVHAVCWHGHKDFLKALFRLAPNAKVTTSFITYNGKEDFEEKFSATQYRNIGSEYYPAQMTDGCDCTVPY